MALACFLACLVLAGTQVLPAFLASDLPARTTQSLVVNVAEGDTLGQLSAMAAQDSRIYTILQNPDAYPQALLEMLARDISLLDFVLGFPEKQGNVYAGSIGSVQQGQFPLLLQWDERWGYGPYGDSFLAISGCAPTALAMVAARPRPLPWWQRALRATQASPRMLWRNMRRRTAIICPARAPAGR